MVSKSKALFIFTAVACLLTVWLAWAIINAYESEALNARAPGSAALSPPLPAAEEAPDANSPPPPVNALEVPVDYALLKGQEPPVVNEAPPFLAAPEKTSASPPENEGSALESSAARNAPPGNAMGRLGSMLSEEAGETESLPPLETPPAATKTPAAEPVKKTSPEVSLSPVKKTVQESHPTPPSAKPKTSPSTPPRPDEASAKFFSVQLAAFSSADNADKLKKELEKAGVRAFITQAKVDGRLWHRVMSGRFRSRAEAVAHETDLVKKKLLKAGEQNRVKTIESGG